MLLDKHWCCYLLLVDTISLFLDVVVVQLEYTAKSENELSLPVGLFPHDLINPI